MYVSKSQCCSCKEFGQIANQCKKKFCKYCEGAGHLITECQKRPQNCNNCVYHTDTSSMSTASMHVVSSPPSSTLTLELVKHGIQYVFTALSLTCKNLSTSSPWHLDSRSSNHLNFSFANLTNVKKCDGDLQIHTADEEHHSIVATGDIPHFLPSQHVFVSSLLLTNLLLVGQLVENNNTTSFSRFVQFSVRSGT